MDSGPLLRPALLLHADPAVTGRPAMPQGCLNTLFCELVRQHKARLYWFVLKHIGNATDAEDLAQQAFVEAASTFERFRGESQLSTWLYGIAMNLVRSYLSRAPHRRYPFEGESALAGVADEAANPEQQLEVRQLLHTLDSAMADLGPEMREVLLLVAVDGMSYEEAAAFLLLPIGTVRSRISRARTKLRQCFDAAGVPLPF